MSGSVPAGPIAASTDSSLERYECDRELGRGAMGAVFLVRDRETGEQLALKKLYRMDGKSALRVKREFRALADLSHPNLVKVYELGRSREGWFLAMEYVEGEDLRGYLMPQHPDKTSSRIDKAMLQLVAERPVLQERVLPAFYQLACGVHALHRSGMLHRDLKPSNVMVANHRVVVLDFGLVRELDGNANAVTEEGAIAGTPAYMAPEQALGQPLSAASDWYAFGVMLYEALTGELPIDGTVLELLRRKLEHEPLPPDQRNPAVPAGLSQLCMALLARDPAARPSGSEVLARLEPVGQQHSQAPGSQSLGDTSLQTDTQSHVTASPLFGRKADLAALWEALHEAETGHTAVVHVRGTSGAGKSALVERFLDQVEQQFSPLAQVEPLVLRSRCYEREAMPFKALDSVIDALSRHLARLDDFDVSNLLPSDIGALSQLFPVLERLRAVQHLLAMRKPTGDAVSNRKRAEEALHELFSRIAARRPVVIWIDDLQWGDLDSARILKGWLQRASGVPLLLVFSYRSDEVDTSECLRSLLQSTGSSSEKPAFCQVVTLSPLAEQDVEALCREQLAPHVRGRDALIERIVRESQGSPFLASSLLALAEVKLARGDSDAHTISIADLVVQTSALLPADAKHLLAVLAVAGRPIVPKLALRAAGLRRGGRELVHALRGLRLVRTRDVAGERLLEVYHDRVREGVARMLSSAQLERIHASLLSVLEYSGRTDPDWLHALALGAGERVVALRYGLAAAERARTALAFERAAELYTRCLELSDESAPDRGGLWTKLAAALVCCGRGASAADAYLQAAKLAAEPDAVGLMRLSASHLLRSGRFEQGEALLRDVLAAMKLSVPDTQSGLIAAIAWERARSSLRGFRYTPRSEREIPAALLARIDAFDALRYDIASIDPVRSAFYQAREQRWALEAGEPTRVLQALCGASYVEASKGSARSERRTDELLASAQALADQLGTPVAKATLCGAQAISFFTMGRNQAVLEPSYEGEQLYRTLDPGSLGGNYFMRFAVVSSRIGALFALGHYRRFAQELEPAVQEARATENVAALLHLALNETLLDEILARPDAALGRLQQQRSLLPAGRFGVYHALHLIAATWAACASGQYASGLQIMNEEWDRFLRSPLPRNMQLSMLAHATRARLLLNEHVLRPAGNIAALVEPDLRAVAGVRPKAYARAAELGLRARLASVLGDRNTAIALLRENVVAVRELGRVVDSSRNSYALGHLLGGDEGAEMCRTAQRHLSDIGVADPARYLLGYWPELTGRS